MSNIITVAPKSKTNEIVKNAVSGEQEAIKSYLPAHISYERFVANCNYCLRQNPDLMACTKDSLAQAFVQSARDGLVPDGREAAIIVYNKKRGNNWIKVAQFQVMIDGLLKKIRQSGSVSRIDAKIVYEGDQFEYFFDVDGEHLMHRPNLSDQNIRTKENFKCVYAVAKTTNGEVLVEVMAPQDIEKVMRSSKGAIDKKTGELYPGSVWDTWWDRMTIKSVLHRLGRRLPNSAEILGSIESDIQIKSFEEQRGDAKPNHQRTAIENNNSMEPVTEQEIETLKIIAEDTGSDLERMFAWVSQKTQKTTNTFKDLDREQFELLMKQLCRKQPVNQEQTA